MPPQMPRARSDPRRGVGLTSLAVAGLGLIAMLTACARSAGINVSPATATPAASATATTASAAQSARLIDFKSPAVAGPIIDHFRGGQIPPERIVYADLTGDRVDDALVVVESGGTAGDLGAAVFSADEGGKPRLLGYIDRAGKVEVRLSGPVAGVIVVTQGSYAPADPQCCPSKLREVILQWDGRQFAVVTDQVIDNPRR